MAFWIGLAIFILASIVAERLLPPQYKKCMPMLVMVVLTFFGLFRYEIGTDYDWYIVLFDTVKTDETELIPIDHLFVNYGFKSSIGNLKEWGVELQRHKIKVN